MTETYTAFEKHDLLIQGPLEDVVRKVRLKSKSDPGAPILVFSDSTGKQMDFDLSGTERDVLRRLQVYRAPAASEATAPAGPGRPRLGVVAREVSLLPQHWEWLSTQPGGASAALRRLVEIARKGASGRDLVRQAQDRTYKVMSAIAGNLPQYEEALRALYAKDRRKFGERLADWPRSLREHLKALAAPAFE